MLPSEPCGLVPHTPSSLALMWKVPGRGLYRTPSWNMWHIQLPSGAGCSQTQGGPRVPSWPAPCEHPGWGHTSHFSLTTSSCPRLLPREAIPRPSTLWEVFPSALWSEAGPRLCTSHSRATAVQRRGAALTPQSYPFQTVPQLSQGL